LSYKAKNSEIKIVEDFSFDNPKTKEMHAILKALNLSNNKTLLLLPKADQTIWKSGRNIPKLNILEATKASTYDILNNHVLLIQKSAVEVLEKQFKSK